MWPFSSSAPDSKSTDDLEKELPDSLKGVFQRENPDHKHDDLFEASKEQKLVSNIIERSKNQPYDYKFDEFKRNEDIKKVTYINCAELQKNVMTCLKNWSATDLTFCDKEMKLNAACTDIQTKALKRLHYEDCVNLTQCKQIRFLVDDLFVKNFGQLGENYNEDSLQKYLSDVDDSFTKIWK